MKIDSVRHITDKKALSDIFNTLFTENQVMLRGEDFNIKVDFVRFESNKIYIRLPEPDYEIHASAIYTRYDDEIYYTHVVPHGKDSELLIFEPEGIQIFKAVRKEERRNTDEKTGKKALITNIISTSVVEESFRHNRSRCEWIRSEIAGKLEGKFEYVRIYLAGDRKSDSRMKWMMQDRKPVFIPAIKIRQGGLDSIDYNRYMNEVYYSDPLLKDGRFNSEIIVPLLYKGMMPFGYVQINHVNILPVEALTSIKRLALAFSESVSGDMLLFRPSEDSMIIKDFSSSGVGILFRERTFMRHFREDELVVFTVFMPEKKRATMMARVMNINRINNFFMVGCMISNIDPIGDVNYQEFLGIL